MDRAIECMIEFVVRDENGELALKDDYTNRGINVVVSNREITIAYGENSLDEFCSIFNDTEEICEVTGNEFTVDARFISSLLQSIVELNEHERELVMSFEPNSELDDCIAVFRTAFATSVVEWNDFITANDYDFVQNSQYITSMHGNGVDPHIIDDESFLTTTLFCSQFNKAMVYRVTRNILL
jgi:hypothetical protein